MQSVLKNVRDEKLRAYFIWLPVIRSDDRGAAVERSQEFQEPRLTHYWDGEQLTGLAWDPVLKTGQIAWDVYLIYGPSATWGEKPPTPSFWMHQLRGIDDAPRLNEAGFEAKVKDLLRSKSQ